MKGRFSFYLFLLHFTSLHLDHDFVVVKFCFDFIFMLIHISLSDLNKSYSTIELDWIGFTIVTTS